MSPPSLSIISMWCFLSCRIRNGNHQHWKKLTRARWRLFSSRWAQESRSWQYEFSKRCALRPATIKPSIRITTLWWTWLLKPAWTYISQRSTVSQSIIDLVLLVEKFIRSRPASRYMSYLRVYMSPYIQFVQRRLHCTVSFSIGYYIEHMCWLASFTCFLWFSCIGSIRSWTDAGASCYIQMGAWWYFPC